jgi:hypothetical protein
MGKNQLKKKLKLTTAIIGHPAINGLNPTTNSNNTY